MPPKCTASVLYFIFIQSDTFSPGNYKIKTLMLNGPQLETFSQKYKYTHANNKYTYANNKYTYANILCFDL